MHSPTYYGEGGYLHLIKDILKRGVEVPDRTGVGCLSIFDAKIVFDEFPFFTHRKISPRLAFEEMWFFLRGETDTKKLEEKGVFFWKGNTSRKFLDSRGLEFLPEGDMGAAYSRQWRDAGGYTDGGGVDQLEKLFKGLKEDRYSRRHIVTLWNAYEESYMPLTPCWHTSQYVVIPNSKGEDTLHVKLLNRSLDVPYGFPFAITQYAMFQLILCKVFGFEVGNISADITFPHIYLNQVDWVKEVVERDITFGESNNIQLNKEVICLEDVLQLEWEDWSVEYEEYNKNPIKAPKPAMSI